MLVEDELKKFSKYVVSQARANLTRKNKNVSRKLYDSIKGETFVGANSIGLYFEMEEYGEFQDKGVQGKTSSAKAPNSPYRFGTGTGKKGGLTESIREWVKARRFQFRDTKTKRFMSYEQTAFLITRSIYHKGIAPSNFFTTPFEKAFERLPDELIEKFSLDIDELLENSLNK